MERDRRGFLRGAGVVLAAALAGCRAPATPQPKDAWSQYRANAARTGFNPHTAGPETGVRERWAFSTESRTASPPTVVDGRVYINSDRVYALSALTGESHWDRPVFFESGAAPAVADGVVYTPSQHALFALDAADGAERWTFSFGNWKLHAPAVRDGTVYFGSTKVGAGFEGRVYALDANGGRVRWTTDLGGGVLPPFVLAVADGTVYAGKEQVYALDAGDGAERWTFDRDRTTFGTPAVRDATVYVGSATAGNRGAVYALDADDGTERWRVSTGLSAKALAVDDDTVYVASDDVYALDAATGGERWRFGSNRFVQASPAVSTGTLYLGGILGSVYALDVDDGTERWHVTTPSSLLSSPAVVGDLVSVMGADRTVYIFGE